MNNRATPEKLMIYKHSLALYRHYNQVQKPTIEWCALNVNHILTSRQTMFKTMKANNLKVGLNALANRLYVLNEKIVQLAIGLPVNLTPTMRKFDLVYFGADSMNIEVIQ